MSDVKKVVAESSSHSGIVPSWLSFVMLVLFVGGCVSGGCSARAGFRAMFKPIVDGWNDCTHYAEY